MAEGTQVGEIKDRCQTDASECRDKLPKVGLRALHGRGSNADTHMRRASRERVLGPSPLEER